MIAHKNTPFGLEWSVGHPGSSVFIAIVKREDEGELIRHTNDLFNDYLNLAPPEALWSTPGGWTYGPQYDRTHTRLHGSTAYAQEKLPVPGVTEGFDFLKKLLQPGDVGYFARPSSWRCARAGKGFCAVRNLYGAQYQYQDYVHRHDRRAAYSSPKYPWLVAVAKYYINRRYPQLHDLAQLYFPLDAKSGEYVIHYFWRGYYDCVDVLYDAENEGTTDDGGNTATGPKLITTNEWIKVNHCEYRSSGVATFTPNADVKCMVVKAGTSVQECMTWCEGKAWCTGLNVVRLTNPNGVRFPTQVNIPFQENECQKANLVKQANDLGLDDSDAMVCYGIDVSGIVQPDVGEKYKSTEDPIDSVFYSTCYRYDEVTSVYLPEGAGVVPAPTPMPKTIANTQYRTGGKCLKCEDVKSNAAGKITRVPKWTLAAECFECRL
jgi:hypothetical protein